MASSLVRPSYQQGFARSGGESKDPYFWDELKGLWSPRLGVTGGTLFDQSGRNNNGVLTNMDPATDWIIGEDGYEIDYTASGSNYTLLSLGQLPTSYPFTIAAIINPSRWPFGASAGQAIFSISDFSSSDDYIALEVLRETTTLKARFLVRESGFLPADSTTDFSGRNSVIIHGVAMGPTERKIYVEGVEEGINTTSVTYPANLDAAAIGVIGRSNAYTTDFADGPIRTIWVWSKGFSSAEVLRHARNPLKMLELADRPIGFVAPAVAAVKLRTLSMMGVGL